jgi:hypothetical protein
MIKLAIDPGLRWCGVALGQGTELVSCALIKNPEMHSRDGMAWAKMAQAVKAWVDTQPQPQHIVCETPMQYMPGHHGGKRVDPADILQIQGVVGALAGVLSMAPFQTIYPYQWKGQLPKDVCFNRIKSRLSVEEMAILEGAPCAKSLQHNVGDAIGIWLDSVKRFKI